MTAYSTGSKPGGLARPNKNLLAPHAHKKKRLLGLAKKTWQKKAIKMPSRWLAAKECATTNCGNQPNYRNWIDTKIGTFYYCNNCFPKIKESLKHALRPEPMQV